MKQYMIQNVHESEWMDGWMAEMGQGLKTHRERHMV